MVALSEADDPDEFPIPGALADAIPDANRALKSISRLENPWWRRIWTVQEAVLPDDLTFQWGPLTLPWDVLDDATQTFFADEPRTAFVADHDEDDVWGSLIAHVAWIRNAKIRGDDEFRMSTPFQLIHRWRWREATNPLDKIYSVLGLFDRGSLPLTGVLIDTAATIGERQEIGEGRPLPLEETLQRWHKFAVLGQQQDVTVALSDMSINKEIPEKQLYPGGLYDRTEAFARLALGDVIRDSQQVPARNADEEDVKKVTSFLQREVEIR
ncbi:hypothetical protein PG993_013366 [Apiospora rasikravindrae]|uniref:Uncharacterized protein n=1 Tax=Apiospora rasikravindrae TaxID=990691 RepID=A0ABR1RXG7_9PEZI